MTETELSSLSKDELEELGRTKGVELDKRLTKSKLIKQIAGLFTSTKKTTASVESLGGYCNNPFGPNR